MITSTAATLMRIRRVRRVTVASWVLLVTDGDGRGGSDAGRALGALPRGVGADRRTGHRRTRGVDGDLVARDREHPVVEAARRRAALLLADPAVLRSVARALEPL